MVLFSEVKSTTGQILFDVNGDTVGEAFLNSTGLGLGVTPASNLHVMGNAIISQNLSIGGVSGSSNLNLHGTLSMAVQSVSANAILSNYSIILADSSSSNITLTLPYAGNVVGREYWIKKTSISNKIWLSGGGNTIDGSSPYELSSSSNSSSIRVISNGFSWYVLSSVDAYSSPASDNLIAWYKMDDTDSILRDFSSRNNHGVLSGNSQASGVLNGSVTSSFSGNIIVPDSDLFSFGNGGTDQPFSMSFWVKFSSTSTYQAFCKKGVYPEANPEYALLLSPTNFQYRLYGSSNIIWLGGHVANPFVNNTWSHVVFTYDGAKVFSGTVLYINGEQVSTIESSLGLYTGMTNTSHAMMIKTANYPTASFDDFRLFNKVLTGREVLALYQVR